ncbi:MAG: metalloregulator ArsR/SmtB family transcription factor [Desulforegulaceae bacterium]|nr:metalloregulator ArsR/SmtB family transcription factor [Desulforegulaceae bacterium]
MKKLTSIFKALSDRNRLRILSALMKYEELCACHIIELIQVTGATVSRHMGVLIASGMVDSRKKGRWVYYRLSREKTDLAALFTWIESQLSHDSSVALDMRVLGEIISLDPEVICRK